MSTSEQPLEQVSKTRPAYWGPRHRFYTGLPEFLVPELKAKAEQSGVTLSEYIAMKVAAAEGYSLPHPRPNGLKAAGVQEFPEQDQLPLGA